MMNVDRRLYRYRNVEKKKSQFLIWNDVQIYISLCNLYFCVCYKKRAVYTEMKVVLTEFFFFCRITGAGALTLLGNNGRGLDPVALLSHLWSAGSKSFTVFYYNDLRI